MEPEEQGIEETGFSNAMAAFKQEEPPDVPDTPVGEPNATVEGEEPKAPEPEAAAPEGEKTAVEAEAPEKPPEFVKFDKPEQLKRFNDVFGYAKRLERELESLRRQQAAPQAQQQPPQPAVSETQPQLFSEARPRLGQFETIEQHEEAVEKWEQRRDKYLANQVKQEIFQEQSRQQTRQREIEEATRYANHINGRIFEGQTKFGQAAFNNACNDLITFAPLDSQMYQKLWGLQRGPEVIMELGKNLQEAERISRLSEDDLVFELKSLEKKLIAKEALATKAQPKLPTKVEAPGQGEDAKTSPSIVKLRQAAKANGGLHDWGKVFQADPTL